MESNITTSAKPRESGASAINTNQNIKSEDNVAFEQETATDVDVLISGEDETSKSPYFKVFDCIRNFLKMVFTFPYQSEPISFFRPAEFNSKGEYIGKEEDEAKADMLESYINFDQVSTQRFEMVLYRRKKDMENLNRLNFEPVDLTKYPSWNEETILYLRTTFKTFDATQDGLLSLENWNDMLYEFGDQSPEEERESRFYRVSDGDSFIDFAQFLDLLYTVTMKDHKSAQTAMLATGIRTANYNISRMKNLDLVQRMQVGMF